MRIYGTDRVTVAIRQRARSAHERDNGTTPICFRRVTSGSDCGSPDPRRVSYPREVTVAPRRLATPSSVNTAIKQNAKSFMTKSR